MRVVPSLDELEDREFRLRMRGEGRAINELAFKGREEALTHRVNVAITHRTHGGSDNDLLAASPEGDRGALGALIGMTNDIAGLALVQSHVQRIQYQLGAQVIGHRPAGDAPCAGIEDHGQKQKPRLGRDLGDIGMGLISFATGPIVRGAAQAFNSARHWVAEARAATGWTSPAPS